MRAAFTSAVAIAVFTFRGPATASPAAALLLGVVLYELLFVTRTAVCDTNVWLHRYFVAFLVCKPVGG